MNLITFLYDIEGDIESSCGKEEERFFNGVKKEVQGVGDGSNGGWW